VDTGVLDIVPAEFFQVGISIHGLLKKYQWVQFQTDKIRRTALFWRRMDLAILTAR
jgi:hypothetical protein